MALDQVLMNPDKDKDPLIRHCPDPSLMVVAHRVLHQFGGVTVNHVKTNITRVHARYYTLWLFNIAMDNCPLIGDKHDDVPVKNGDFSGISRLNHA